MSIRMSGEVIRAADEVRDLPWRPLAKVPGVSLRTLWRDPRGSSYAGLMKMEPGASMPRHAHRFATHHVWVDLGSCRIGDRTIGPGGYVHIPVGVEHGIDEAGPGGCTLFYLYLATAELD